MRELLTASTAFVALKAATFFFGIAGAIVQFTLATITAVRGMTLLNTVMSKSVLGAIAKLIITLGAAGVAWEFFGKEALDTAAAIEQSAAQLEEKLDIAPDTAGIKALRDELVLSNNAMQQLIGRYRDFPATVQSLTDGLELESEAKKENIDLSTEQGRAWADAFEESQRLKRSLKDVQSIYEDSKTPLQTLY